MVRVVEVRWSYCKLCWIIFWLVVPLYSAVDIDCESPQYVKLGQQGVISCTFPETFHGIYWYDHENVTSDDRPFILYIRGLKSGPGFNSHEYDIHPNGSLVINSVSVLHNHFYGVTVLERIDRDPAFKPVSVKVFASPVEQYPKVGCEDEKLCFMKVKPPTSLSCTIDRVGDIIDLSWILRTKNGNESTSSQQVTVPNSANELQSHRVDINVPLKTSPSISLYVCSANSSVPEVESEEAAILVDHGTSTQKELSPILLEKSVAETVTMECGDGTPFFLVWQKRNQDVEPIAYTVSRFAGERIHKTNFDGFILENDNSLTINAVDELSAGIYICLYSQDGTTTSHLSYEVTIQENGTEMGVLLIIFLAIFITLLVLLLIVGLFCKRRRRGKDANVGTVFEGDRLVEKNPALPTDKRGRVVLSSKDSEDTLRNTLQLLKNASESKEVKLEHCFLSVEDNGSALRLTSNVLFDPIATMRRLDFDFPSDGWREFEESEVKNILQYVARCTALEEINFANSLLPLELKDIVEEMKTKTISKNALEETNFVNSLLLSELEDSENEMKTKTVTDTALEETKYVNPSQPSERKDSSKETKTKAIIFEWTTNAGAGVVRLNFKTRKWENRTGELLTTDYANIKEKAKKAKQSKNDAAEQSGEEITTKLLMQDGDAQADC